MFDWTEWADASFAIKLHMGVAVVGIAVGTFIMIARRGTVLHRWLGRGFALAALMTAFSSLFIHEINQWGQWSWIHLLSVYTLVSTTIGWWAIRKGNVKLHMRCMMPVYTGGFIIAGGFTFLPGRMMFDMFLEPTFQRVFSGDWQRIEQVAWALPMIGVVIAIAVYLKSLVIPLRRQTQVAD